MSYEHLPSDQPTESEFQWLQPVAKRKILSTLEYRRVVIFIEGFNGLSMDCEEQMIATAFTHIEPQTLKSIIACQYAKHLQVHHSYYERNIRRYLRAFEQLSKEGRGPSVIVHLAVEENVNPVTMARFILGAKFGCSSKTRLEDFIRNPKRIPNRWLAANVATCLANDNLDGPKIAIQERQLLAEYEVRLKDKCHGAGVLYTDQHQLQLMGFQTRPNLKLILPIKYKGQEIFWIDSKVAFGDIASHVHNVQHLFSRFVRLFGSGLVIYWYGYEEGTPEATAYASRLLVLADFPAVDDIELKCVGDMPMSYGFDVFKCMNEAELMRGLD